MKTLRHIFPGICLLATLLVSCIADPIVTVSEGQEVLVTVNAVTRAGTTDAGDEKDRRISKFRVLGYRMSDGKLAFNKPVSLTFNSQEEKYSGTIEVKTGSFNIVFIANEGSDTDTETLLDGLEVNNSSITDLQTVTFSHEAFASNKNIPMVTLKENVQIVGEDKLVDDGIPVNGEWSIPMKRLGVRIDMTLDKTGQTVTGDLVIQKVPNAVYLLSGQNNDATGYTTKEIAYTIDADNNDILIWDRIILPESMFSPKNTKEKGVVLSLEVDGSDCKAVIGLDAFNETEQDRDYTLPRNTYLSITATAETPELNYTATVVPWDEVSQKVIFDGKFSLKVDEDEFVVIPVAKDVYFTAETDYTITTQGFEAGLKIYVQEETDWLSIEDVSMIGGNKTKDGDEKRTININVEENTSDEIRNAKVYVTAGNMTKIINVKQLPNITDAGTPLNDPTYVGAFWRADQTGERLIRITNIPSAAAGNWMVQVLDYGDGFNEGDIVFSSEMSLDPNIGWLSGADKTIVADMNFSANDTKYRVNENNTFIKGTAEAGGDIFFRIGLKSKWDPTPRPARYAVIVLSYNNNTKFQKMWLRQGEGADYLMYPGDTDEDGNIVYSGRHFAKEWSPFNLTSIDLTDGVQFYEMESEREGTFVDYPTQIGAFFQGATSASDYELRAYSPTYKLPVDWLSSNPKIECEYINETCPDGYRRPLTSNETVNCELEQSFKSKYDVIKINNSIRGYYADGFFDRRTPEISTIGDGNFELYTVVAQETIKAAYIGMIIFNPVYDSPRKHASIFFPTGGARKHENGEVYLAGVMSGYWTKIIESDNFNIRSFNLTMGSFSINKNTPYTWGYSVRCVVDETND